MVTKTAFKIYWILSNKLSFEIQISCYIRVECINKCSNKINSVFIWRHVVNTIVLYRYTLLVIYLAIFIDVFVLLLHFLISAATWGVRGFLQSPDLTRIGKGSTQQPLSWSQPHLPSRAVAGSIKWIWTSPYFWVQGPPLLMMGRGYFMISFKICPNTNGAQFSCFLTR